MTASKTIYVHKLVIKIGLETGDLVMKKGRVYWPLHKCYVEEYQE